MPINASTLPLEQIARVKAKPLATAVFRETTPDDGPGDILYSERMHITLSKAKSSIDVDVLRDDGSRVTGTSPVEFSPCPHDDDPPQSQTMSR